MLHSLNTCSVGEELPPLTLEPITRHMLALYCGASGDPNPVHTDSDFAREQAGLPDVIGHGMLSMAMAGRLLSSFANPRELRSFAVRFVGMTQVHDRLTCRARVEVRTRTDNRSRFVLAVTLNAHDGRLVLRGEAEVVLERQSAPHAAHGLLREGSPGAMVSGQTPAQKGAPHAAHGLLREGSPGAMVSGQTPAQKEPS